MYLVKSVHSLTLVKFGRLTLICGTLNSTIIIYLLRFKVLVMASRLFWKIITILKKKICLHFTYFGFLTNLLIVFVFVALYFLYFLNLWFMYSHNFCFHCFEYLNSFLKKTSILEKWQHCAVQRAGMPMEIKSLSQVIALFFVTNQFKNSWRQRFQNALQPLFWA